MIVIRFQNRAGGQSEQPGVASDVAADEGGCGQVLELVLLQRAHGAPVQAKLGRDFFQ